MKLTPEQISNLTLLANFMEGLDDPKFTMTIYRHDCNTPACAFGWACKVPALQKMGLRFELTEGYRQDERLATIEHIFGDESYQMLFRSGLDHTIKTPQQWAAHCRAFLKENGYEVKPKPDPFKVFMEKTLEPVDTEEFHPWRTA